MLDRNLALIVGIAYVMTLITACVPFGQQPEDTAVTASPMPSSFTTDDVNDPTPSSSQPSPILGPDDFVRLGFETRETDPSGTIPMDNAVEIADSELGLVATEAQKDAFLVEVNDERLPGAHRVWIVRYSKIAVPFPGPYTTADVTPAGHVARFAYVLLDAMTGDHLLTTWSE